MKYSEISNFDQLLKAIRQSETRSGRAQKIFNGKLENFRLNFKPLRYIFDLLQRSFVGFTMADMAIGIARGVGRLLFRRK